MWSCGGLRDAYLRPVKNLDEFDEKFCRGEMARKTGSKQEAGNNG